MNLSKEGLADWLQACGIAPEIRGQILACMGSPCRQLCLLGRERSVLLRDLHRLQRRLDLVDLLIDSLKHEDKER